MQDSPDLHEVRGAITSIVYQDAERGFVIAELTPDEGQPLTIVGTIPGAIVGENLRVRGRWEKHAKYGQQLRLESYELVRPSTAQGIIAYLSGGLVKGIGPKLAGALVAHFGEGILDILDHQPGRLTEVPGIGGKKAAALATSWQEHKEVHRIMLFLQEHGAGPTLAGRIYERYRSAAMHVMEAEPYRLAREVRGIGFHTADRMARAAGIRADDPQRIQAGVLHALTEAAGEGHFFLPGEHVLSGAQQVLHVDDQLIELALEAAVQAGYVEAEPFLPSPERRGVGGEADAVPHPPTPSPGGGGGASADVAYFLPDALQIEKELAGLLLRLSDKLITRAPTSEQTCAWLGKREDMGALPLTPTQAAAVCSALQQPVTIITGGPGTGKTTITRAIADGGVGLKWRVALCSPTGRAAKRLSQLSGQPASTIHRLLSWDPGAGRFRFNEAEPLPVDLLIVDEASMVDAPLARDLLRAVPPGAQVVFIGDADQLPSVGPGNFLRDLIACERFAVVCLTDIFRQAEGGEIVANAHLIREGEMPPFIKGPQWQGEDCVLMERETAEDAAQAVLKVVTRSLPALQYQGDAVQVITPMHRGPAGVAALNVALQQALNPPRPGLTETRRGDTIFREGDRVLQTANDYDRNVFNGDIGRVERIDLAAKIVVVHFDQAPVIYEFSDLDQLELAYALTIHKAQGSEYPAVVMVIHSTHYIMLKRNLFYTALTRAEKLAVIVGDRKGVWKAIKTAGENERFTRLAARLRGELPHMPIQEHLPL
jgi:exodeoxyribonuclease V alpha subunit